MPQEPRNPNQSLLLIAVVLLLLGVGSLYFYFLPNLKTARQQAAQSQAKDQGLQTDIATLQSAQNELDLARQSLQSRGIDLDKLSSVYPQYEDIPTLYIQMEYLMGATQGISSATYQISAPTTDQTGARVRVCVSATGGC